MQSQSQEYLPPPGSPLAGVAKRFAHGGDIVFLEPTAYAAYAKIVRRVCWALQLMCRGGAERNFFRALSPLVDRLAASFEILLELHSRSPVHDLSLDLKDSGFPNGNAIMAMAGDLQNAPSTMEQGTSRTMLKEQALHEIFKGHDPVEIVWAFARRLYLRRLIETQVFLPFTFGALKSVGPVASGRRAYEVTWGIYDIVRSLPVLFHMEFEWSGELPIDEDPVRKDLLIDALRAESVRSSGVGQLAKVLDLNLPQLHPKMVRRISVGPLRTARFTCDAKHVLCEALRAKGEVDDFILEITVSGAESIGEFEPQARSIVGRVTSLLNPPKPHQRFDIDFGDPVLGQALASFVNPMLLLPHGMVKLLEGRGGLDGYQPSALVTFDRESVHVPHSQKSNSKS